MLASVSTEYRGWPGQWPGIMITVADMMMGDPTPDIIWASEEYHDKETDIALQCILVSPPTPGLGSSVIMMAAAATLTATARERPGPTVTQSDLAPRPGALRMPRRHSGRSGHR